jgi:chaperonin cofactor prefoldin
VQALSELAAYQDLGAPFQEVVATYQRLRQELESAQQALSTFTALEDELMRRQ